jgi:hypothetical protein
MDFCADYTSNYLGLIGGFGCGKTKAFCYKTVIMAGLNAGYEGAILEPTNFLVRTHLVPNMEAVLFEMKIPFDFDKSHAIFHIHFKEGTTKVYCLSGENYTRLVGYNLAFVGSDETDTSGHEIAQEMWNKAVSRVRFGPHRQIYTTSTPEGFKFLHEYFVSKPAKLKTLEVVMGEAEGVDEPYIREHIGRNAAGEVTRAIHATSYENPITNDGKYLQSMQANYSPSQWKVWALGQFGNLNNKQVYDSFDRVKNHTDLHLGEVPKHVQVCIGIDFNVDNMSAIAHVMTGEGPRAVKEYVNIADTPALIRAIRYDPDLRGRSIVTYPDASAKNRNANGFDSSLALLEQAGLNPQSKPANPAVGDRVNSMNAMFLNAKGERRYLVNTHLCPVYTECLEKQAKLPNGEPDKSGGVDHPLDAAGYFIYWHYPLQGKPGLSTYG